MKKSEIEELLRQTLSDLTLAVLKKKACGSSWKISAWAKEITERSASSPSRSPANQSRM